MKHEIKEVGRVASSATASLGGNTTQGAVVSETVKTAKTALVLYNVAEKTVDKSLKFSKKIMTGSYKTGKTIYTITNPKNSTTILQNGGVKFTKHSSIKTLERLAATKIKKCKLVVKTRVAVDKVKTATKIAKGVVKGRYIITRLDVKRVSKKLVLGSLKLSGKTTLKLTKGIAKGTFNGSKKALKGIHHIGGQVGSALMSNENSGIQGMGYSINVAHYTVEGVKTGVKGIKTGVQGIKTAASATIKTGKVAAKTVQSVQQVGIKKTAGKVAKKTGKAAVKGAGKLVGKVFGTITKKALLPLIVVVAIVCCVCSVVSILTASTSVIFGKFTSRDDGSGNLTEIDEEVWLMDKISQARTLFYPEVLDTRDENLIENGGNYHIVRFYNAFTDTEITLTPNNIVNCVYTIDEYYELIQPLFHVIMLMEYDLAPTEEEMEDTFQEMWGYLTQIKTEELPIEYCGDEHDFCGHRHANNDCPNMETGTHSEFTCNSCCYHYYVCKGEKGSLNCGRNEHYHFFSEDEMLEYWGTNSPHVGDMYGCWLCIGTYDGGFYYICALGGEHTHSNWNCPEDSGCYATYYHAGEYGNEHSTMYGSQIMHSGVCTNYDTYSACNGYKYCNGHKVVKLFLKVGDWDSLLNKYFDEEIADLESIEENDRTDEEQDRLKDLKDYRNIAVDYIEILKEKTGSNDEIIDISEIQLNSVTSYACQYIGNPFKYGGTSLTDGCDSLGFVRSVFYHFGITLPDDYTSLADTNFNEMNYEISYENAHAGDILIYSVSGSSGAYHAGIYLGNGLMVHSSNSKSYPEGGIKVSKVYKRAVYKVLRPINNP